MQNIFLLCSILPFLMIFVLMIGFRRPAYIAMPLVFGMTSIFAWLLWDMDRIWFEVSLLKAFLVTLDILLIIFGVVFYFSILKNTNVFKSFENGIKSLSHDRRIQAIIVGWLFVSLIEGAAGFGTPAMLAAPLMIHIGFPALLAAIIALIGDSIAVSFGAVGVPVTLGLTQGLPTSATQNNHLLAQIVDQTVLIYLIIGFLVPLGLSCAVTVFGSGSIQKGLQAWKFAILSGLSFTIPMYIIARFLGPEFPSLLGAIIGLGICLILIKFNIGLPAKLYVFPHEVKYHFIKQQINLKLFIRSLSPYILVVSLLAFSRIPILPFKEVLQSSAVEFDTILNTEINHNINIFYSPLFFFLLSSVIVLMTLPKKIILLKESALTSFNRIKMPFISLFATLSIVNILQYSGNNSNNIPSMLSKIVDTISIAQSSWIFVAPFLGVIGAFITGSATVSNLLFSGVQYQIGSIGGYNTASVLSLQLIGASLGNMIAIHNIVAVIVVANMHGKEHSILKYTLLPVILLSVIASIVTAILSPGR